MTHFYTTYINRSESLACRHCKQLIGLGNEFAVVSSRSLPIQENCLPCTDQRLDSGEQITIDDAPGKVPMGMQRLPQQASQ